MRCGTVSMSEEAAKSRRVVSPMCTGRRRGGKRGKRANFGIADQPCARAVVILDFYHLD